VRSWGLDPRITVRIGAVLTVWKRQVENCIGNPFKKKKAKNSGGGEI